MTKLLKVLVVILLLLSIGALTLGTMLFIKREILKGRTHKLENAVIALGTTIEAEAAQMEVKPEYPARDISSVTSEILDTPDLSDFWESYSHEFEMQDQAPLDLRPRQEDLMRYYKVDPVTGKAERDVQGRKITTGEGTMQGVLDDLLGKSEEQLNRLNATRQQLADLRIELVATIREANRTKGDQRRALKKIEELEAEINRLNNEIVGLKQNIAELEEAKRSLEETITEQQRQMAQLEEQKVEKDATIDMLREELKKYEDAIKRPTAAGDTRPAGGPAPTFRGQIGPGQKGTVAAVNADWNFVVVNLSDEFMAELLSDEEAGIPQVGLMVRRPDGQFVTKIKLLQVKQSEKLGVCDMLPDWQQAPVEKGDVVFY